MSQNIITASYNNAITVSFTNDAWFNATEVAKQFSKESNNWLMQRDTAEYVATLGDMISESKTCFLQEFNKIIDLNGESAASRAKTLKETPPRMWGRPTSVSAVKYAPRNTPTHVGKTFS